MPTWAHITTTRAQEIHAWARLGSHPNVVRYYSSWFEHGSHGGEHAFIQLEKCAPLLLADRSLPTPRSRCQQNQDGM